MNLNELKKLPDDPNAVKAPKFDSIEKDQSNLRQLILQGASNIIANNVAFATIKDLESEIAKSGYQMFFVPLQGSTAFADLYLKKF